mgnify:CR=1 FL=1
MLNIFFCISPSLHPHIFVAVQWKSLPFSSRNSNDKEEASWTIDFLTWKENKALRIIQWQQNDFQGFDMTFPMVYSKVKLMMMRLSWHNQDSLWTPWWWSGPGEELRRKIQLQLGMLKVKVEVNQMLIGMGISLAKSILLDRRWSNTVETTFFSRIIKSSKKGCCTVFEKVYFFKKKWRSQN